MRVYRVSSVRRSKDLSGEGAGLHGGRWNSKGTNMLYTSSTASLALLEFLVHTRGTPGITDFALITIQLPKSTIASVDINDLPDGWDKPMGAIELREIGDTFVIEHRSLALQVPSALLPTEPNYLINPQHPLAKKMKIVEVIERPIDPRFLN